MRRLFAILLTAWSAGLAFGQAGQCYEQYGDPIPICNQSMYQGSCTTGDLCVIMYDYDGLIHCPGAKYDNWAEEGDQFDVTHGMFRDSSWPDGKEMPDADAAECYVGGSCNCEEKVNGLGQSIWTCKKGPETLVATAPWWSLLFGGPCPQPPPPQQSPPPDDGGGGPPPDDGSGQPPPDDGGGGPPPGYDGGYSQGYTG